MDKKFIDGLFFDRNEKAPEYVKGKISIQVEKFIKYLTENVNEKGYVNIDLKQSQNGKYYAELNTWKPEKKEVAEEEINVDDLPF